MQKLHRRRPRFNGWTVGLDVHKRFIEYVVLDRHGNEADTGRLDSDREALTAFAASFSRKQVQVSLEACGSFLWVFDVCSAQVGRERVHVAQPSRVRVIANSMEKTDTNDAWWLAYLLYEGRLPEAYVAEGDLRELRLAARELRDSTDRRGDLIRRFRAHLAQEGIRLVSTNFNAKRTRRRAKDVADSIDGVRGLALRKLLEQIESWDNSVKYWREEMARVCQSFPDVQKIQEGMPGMGPIIAASLIGELGDPRRYYAAKAYAKASGLTPSTRESGGQRASSRISRAGSCLARWSLTRAVIGCLRCRNGPGVQIRRWIDHRKRLRHKKCVYAVAARKLAEGVWRLFHYGECFDVARAFPA